MSEVPTDTIYSYEYLGQIPFTFVVAPHHPLAQNQGTLTYKHILPHRIIIVPDTAKNISKATTGYVPDRSFLKVASIEHKIQAHLAGLGVGFLPLRLVKPYIDSGLLVEKKVDRPKTAGRCFLAWRVARLCPALDFFITTVRQNKNSLISNLYLQSDTIL